MSIDYRSTRENTDEHFPQICSIIDERTLWEWKNFQDNLQFEIEKTERQLATVEKRQKALRCNIWISFSCMTVPFLLAFLAGMLCDYASEQTDVRVALLLSFTYGMKYGLRVLALLLFPVMLFYFQKAVRAYLRHNPKKVQWKPPAVRIFATNMGIYHEPNCEAEKMKLLWILSKYRFYQEKIAAINEEMENGSSELDSDGLKAVIKTMPFYEEIRPARV